MKKVFNIRIIQIILIGLFSVYLNINAQNIAPKAKRPNIIFLLTDDQRWDAIGYAGNETIYTPNMDKLAQQGVWFRNAFVTTPVCAASRASIMTGLYERKHHYTFEQPPVPKKLIAQTYFTLLKQAGYYTGYLGKFGVEFENNMEKELFDVYHPYKRDFYFRLTDGATKHIHLTDLMGLKAVEFIEKAPSGKPFCLTVSYHAPHAEDKSPEQFIYPLDMDTLYRNVTIPEPPLNSDYYFEQEPEYVRQGFNRVRWYWRFDTPGKYQKMVKGYYRMISGIDRTIGKIMDELEKKGIADNTIIILMGDNGYFLGERQLAGKWLMYDNSLRVPLIIYDPRTGVHRDVNDMVLNVDISPTILGYAGVKIPESYQGISLTGYTTGKQSPAKNRDAFLCEHLWKFKPIPASEGVRTREYKYFRYREHPEHEELYDLIKDPLEKNNLAGERKYRKILEELRNECDGLISKLQ